MKKVMIVEDEELILQGIRSIIDWESLGLEVIHMAHNGVEALRMWKEEPVEIVISDIEMPEMGGLELMKEIRKVEEQVRFIILTGYDEFEYAREAIRLEVENYILKPIDEEVLEKQLRETVEKLDELAKKKMKYIDEKAEWVKFLSGKMTQEIYEEYKRELRLPSDGGTSYVAVMKWDVGNLREKRMTDVVVAIYNRETNLRVIYLRPDAFLLLLTDFEAGEDAALEYFQELQNRLESELDFFTFISIGFGFTDYRKLPECYKEAMKLQKYLLIDGYGSCVDQKHIQSRKSGDVIIDHSQLRKLILKKEKDGALGYVEDLFINNVKNGVSVDTLYQMAVQMAMFLHEIKKEYKLDKVAHLYHLPELIEEIYRADDIFGIKTAFNSEIIEIIDYLHEEDSQYTPVVKQIIQEVQKKYMEDMNLKTLAYKYHMNASYLGQIFQKEVGCSFAQYLSDAKNGAAKDLILNTNMKINDIARKVGYQDTSYFYRKFKQCYGVSPASLREMKKY